MKENIKCHIGQIKGGMGHDRGDNNREIGQKYIIEKLGEDLIFDAHELRGWEDPKHSDIAYTFGINDRFIIGGGRVGVYPFSHQKDHLEGMCNNILSEDLDQNTFQLIMEYVENNKGELHVFGDSAKYGSIDVETLSQFSDILLDRYKEIVPGISKIIFEPRAVGIGYYDSQLIKNIHDWNEYKEKEVIIKP